MPKCTTEYKPEHFTFLRTQPREIKDLPFAEEVVHSKWDTVIGVGCGAGLLIVTGTWLISLLEGAF